MAIKDYKSDSIDLRNFPTTRYQGSKRKIIPWIYDITKRLEFSSVLDAFGGTGIVSYLFKKMGKSVTFNDILRFNYLTGKAIIENQDIKLTEEDINNLINNTYKHLGFNFIQDNFRDIYYLNNENKWLDSTIGRINSLNSHKPKALEYKKSIAYRALFQSCLIKRPFNLFHRKNLNLRTNLVKRKFGNKTTWDKPFQKHYINFIEETNRLIFNSHTRCKAINKDVLEIVENNFDLVYLDPPYYRKESSNETSNYLKCYHFLEGIADYNNWRKYIDLNTQNLTFKKEFIPPEQSEANIKECFEQLFSKFHSSIIVLSYKRGGVPSVDYLQKLMRKFKKNVYSLSIQYNYALNRQNGETKKNREVLIIGL